MSGVVSAVKIFYHKIHKGFSQNTQARQEENLPC